MTDAIDAWIRRLGIDHAAIVPVLRNQLILLLLVLTGGGALAGPKGVWAGAGFAAMTFVLFSWARFFSRVARAGYASVSARSVVVRFLLRLVLLAGALWACLGPGGGDPFWILGGVAAGTLAPLFTLSLGKGTKN